MTAPTSRPGEERRGGKNGRTRGAARFGVATPRCQHAERKGSLTEGGEEKKESSHLSKL